MKTSAGNQFHGRISAVAVGVENDEVQIEVAPWLSVAAKQWWWIFGHCCRGVAVIARAGTAALELERVASRWCCSTHPASSSAHRCDAATRS